MDFFQVKLGSSTTKQIVAHMHLYSVIEFMNIKKRNAEQSVKLNYT